jgi:hypothetical protein
MRHPAALRNLVSDREPRGSSHFWAILGREGLRTINSPGTLNRIAVGMFFMLSGYHKLFNPERHRTLAEQLKDLGIRAAGVSAGAGPYGVDAPVVGLVDKAGEELPGGRLGL